MRILLMLALSLMYNCSFADDEIDKKWELGLGVGDIYSPDYRGSDEYRNYIAPIPYVIYRGKYIQSDRDGLRGNIFKSDRYEFTFSATATISQKADENIAREAMPTLGSTVEMGPALNVNLTEKTSSRSLILQIPVHAVIAVTGSTRGYSGLVFQPQLIYRNNIKNWQFTQRLGASVANQKYHDYYYSVDQEFVTPERNFFDAHGGYSGWNNNMALSRSFNHNGIKTRLALFIRYDNISGADFNKSPLVVTDHAYRGGLAFIWVIK